MNESQTRGIVDWFKDYAESFSAKDGTLSRPLQLKREHSQRVAGNARRLAEGMRWSLEDSNRAEVLGWLHDVGRFSQYAEFCTFSDADSINHGERGRRVVRENGILCSLAPDVREALLDAIRHHNVRAVPDSLTRMVMMFVLLIRDADKLDIFRIVLESVELDGFQELPTMLPQIDLEGPVNPKLIGDIMARRSCPIGEVRSLVDFLLMQLSWIHDLNYPETFRLMLERNIPEKLMRALPPDRGIQQIGREVLRFSECEAVEIQPRFFFKNIT